MKCGSQAKPSQAWKAWNNPHLPVCTFSGVGDRKLPRGNQWQCRLSCCGTRLLPERICLNLKNKKTGLIVIKNTALCLHYNERWNRNRNVNCLVVRKGFSWNTCPMISSFPLLLIKYFLKATGCFMTYKYPFKNRPKQEQFAMKIGPLL